MPVLIIVVADNVTAVVQEAGRSQNVKEVT